MHQPEPLERPGEQRPSRTELDSSPPRGKPFPIVGIGASAGGLDAFAELLAALPHDTGMAFVLIQHLDPSHESHLAELLVPHTRMPLVSVQNGVEVEPERVYVIPPNKSMELEHGRLTLVKREPGLHLPIDIFFRSLAKEQGSRAIGVVLSGNASDGSLGVKAIKAECGLTFAQDEASARYAAMPRNAMLTGAVDYVLPPDDIAKELASIARHPFLLPARSGDGQTETLPEGDGELQAIFALLMAATRVDFSRYKPTTVRRRIGRRMMVLRVETLAEYLQLLSKDTVEVRDLYRDLLISVTSFFRDPDAFRALARAIENSLNERKRNETQPMRVWVPGCATGEEVFSLAICLQEVLEERKRILPLQFFGTDISEIALDRARQGMYPEIIADDVSQERLRRFFVKTETGYQICKAIRESCIFARHDVTRDPPFSNLDLVSCRNLLIYLDQSAQRRVLPVFHYALRPHGLLMLGSAESVSAGPDLFAPIDHPNRIYSRRERPTRLALDLAPSRSAHFDGIDNSPARVATVTLDKKLDRLIQSKYSPDAVLVNGDMQIVQFRGHTHPFLEPSPGAASLDVLRMARETLVVPLRRAVHAAAESNATVAEKGIALEIAGQLEEITLEVTPISGAEPTERFFLIAFLRQRPRERPAQPQTEPVVTSDDHVRLLQRELTQTRDSLRTLTEEYEAHSEELRAANEEARSANEELQSTNEELGTTKEELQSANEELTTVNEELQHRNEELSAIANDLQNLLGAVSLAIVMVDSDLRVRRFNPAASVLFDLGMSDIGRPVGHVRGRIETQLLEEQIKTVLRTLNGMWAEVQDLEGRWFSIAIRPYRTVDDRIAGAVITAQDIDPLKRGLQAAEEARDYAAGMIETVREPLVVLDADLRVQRATPSFYETFLVTREETEGRFIYDLGSGQWNHPRLRELLGAALFRSEPFHDFEMEHDFPHIGRRTMRLNARRLPRPDAEARMLLLSIEDVTERRQIAEIRFQRLFETAKDGIVVLDVETESVVDVNPCFLELTGYSRDRFVGRTAADAAKLLHARDLTNIVRSTRDKEVVSREDLQLTTRSRAAVSVDVIGSRYLVGNQPVVQLNVRDISARKQALRALRESEERFRLFVESVRDYALVQLDNEGSILSWNAGAQRLLGWTEAEAIGKHSGMLFVPEDVAQGEHEREIETARTHGRAEDERWHLRKDGSRFFASGVLTQLCDEHGNRLGFAKIMRDITARKQQEEQLQRSLEEKSMLVREIHHRVKNNLQVIVSLLSLQANNSSDPRVLEAFEETENRVRAIAQIHERLYASDDLTEVEFASYLTQLTRELLALHSSRGPERVSLELVVTDMVLTIEQAIPLALIVNELIVNSLKHGFKSGGGRLTITLKYVKDSFNPALGETPDDGWGEVLVADTGPGLPEQFDPSRTGSLGYRLVRLLIRQLRGEMKIASGPGASVIVSFPLKHKEPVKEKEIS